MNQKTKEQFAACHAAIRDLAAENKALREYVRVLRADVDELRCYKIADSTMDNHFLLDYV